MPFVIQKALGDFTGRTLVTRSGAFRVERGDVLRIGRGTNAQLRFEEASVALEHARLERTPEGYRLIPLGDRGIFLNQQPLAVPAVVTDGDEVGIGPYLLLLKLAPEAGAPLFVQVQRLAATPSPAPAAAPLAAPVVDYVAAYRLRRRLLSKGLLALLLAAGTTAALLPLARGRNVQVLQPGAVSDPHAKALERRGVALAAAGCAFCHVAGQGVASARCLDCHPGAEVHSPRQVSAPACTDCHGEHRGRPLTAVTDGDCGQCHGDLQVADGEPRVAARITGFATGHPEFALAQPAARRSDPATLRLNHARHLQPDLRGPAGREQLACDACHALAAGGQDLAPVSFEANCQRCHRLTFDPAFPDFDAVHAAPRQLEGDLSSFYGRVQGGGSLLEWRPGRSRPDRTGGGGQPVASSAEREARRAARLLYAGACSKCHALDLAARPYPVVAPVAVTAHWLSAARFSHGPHLAEGIACAACHPGVEASRDSADVLLPGIASCTASGCHDGRSRSTSAAGVAGLSDCITCHGYHRQPEPGAQVASLGRTSP